jgi:hypothetical protein
MATKDENSRSGRASVQKGAALVGIVFLVVGVAGFIPGITTNYSSLMFATHHSDAQLLGLFQVSVLHNAVHLLFGVAGLLLARTPLRARNFLLYGGLVYFALFAYGVLIEYQSSANFVPVDDADNWLHLVLAAGMLALSFLLDRGPGWRRTIIEGKASV